MKIGDEEDNFLLSDSDGEEDQVENQKESDPEEEDGAVFTEPLKPSNTKKGQWQRQELQKRKGRAPEVKGKEEIATIPMATPLSDVDNINFNNRPTVKVIEKDGYSPRKKRAVSLGLSELILPPFTKGVIAKYRLISSGHIDPATGQEPEPQDAWWPGTYTLNDKYESDPLRRSKLMKNLGREELVVDASGKEERKFIINPIMFEAGIKTVNIETNYREYVFLELHPLNASNRHRDNTVTAAFERIDIKHNRTAAMEEAQRDLAIDAEVYVQKTITKSDLIMGYATAFGINTHNRMLSDVKMDLRKAAAANPIKFFSMAKDASPGIRLNIHSAMSNGLIEYETDKRRFIFCENRESIHQVGVQEDMIESIVKAIQKEPQKMVLYEQIVEMLNYWEQ